MREVKWGILGLGKIAESFAKGLEATPGAKLYACGSRDAAKAEAFGSKWGASRRHGSWEALCADPEVEAIYVATPHPFHKEACLLALNNGKAALCEKPFAMNAAETLAIISLAKEKRLFLMEAMWMRFLPQIQLAKTLLAEGAIGELRMLDVDFSFRCDGDVNGRLLNHKLGGGGLLDVGVYAASLAHFLLGAPRELKALGHLGPTGVDEQAMLLLGYHGGALASLSCAVMTPGSQEALLTGVAGRLKIRNPWWGRCPGLELTPLKGEPKQFKPVFLGNGYNYEAAEVARCLESGLLESPVIPHAETLAVMRTLDEARRQLGLSYPQDA